MGRTVKRYNKSYFDDDNMEHHRKQAGKRNHSRFYENQEDDLISELEEDHLYEEYAHFLKK